MCCRQHKQLRLEPVFFLQNFAIPCNPTCLVTPCGITFRQGHLGDLPTSPQFRSDGQKPCPCSATSEVQLLHLPFLLATLLSSGEFWHLVAIFGHICDVCISFRVYVFLQPNPALHLPFFWRLLRHIKPAGESKVVHPLGPTSVCVISPYSKSEWSAISSVFRSQS